MTRRDKCVLVGKRASLLDPAQAREAWYQLAILLDGMGEKDIPKFNDLLRAIRLSTIYGASRLTVPDGDASYAAMKQAIADVCSKSDCPNPDCDGGRVDTGGISPWGSPIYEQCPDCAEKKNPF